MINNVVLLDQYTRALDIIQDLAAKNNLTCRFTMYVEAEEMIFIARFADDYDSEFIMEVPINNIADSRFPEALIKANFSTIYEPHRGV